MRDGPTTPMVQSNTNPLGKNRPPSGNRKTSKVENADLANELGINPWDQKAPLRKHMERRQASLNRLREAHGLKKESKINLDDEPKKSELDTENMTGSSTAFSKRSGTSKGLEMTDPWAKSKMTKHQDLLARPATEFIQSINEVQEIQVPGGNKKKPSKLKPIHNASKSKDTGFKNIAEKFI